MLDRIQAGDLKGAKVLLDWLREDQHLEGGDDPLGGPVFPRFWIKGEAADARKMKLAAAAILVGTKPTVAAGRRDSRGRRSKTRPAIANAPIFELALAEGYMLQDNFPQAARSFLGAAQAGAGIEAGLQL